MNAAKYDVDDQTLVQEIQQLGEWVPLFGSYVVMMAPPSEIATRSPGGHTVTQRACFAHG